MANYCCGNCEILDINGGVHYGDEYYCKHDGKTHKVTSPACSAIVKNKAIRDKESKEWHPSGWKFYIVTVISKIVTQLYGSDVGLLDNLSKIRSEFLEKSPEYQSTIEDYDVYGPLIASIIDSMPEEEKNKIAIYLSNNYLMPAMRFILKDNYQEATRIYFQMVNMLKMEYNLINYAPTAEDIDDLANYEYNLIKTN